MTRRNLLAVSSILFVSTCAIRAGAPDLVAFAGQLERTTLDAGRAVDAKGFVLELPYGSLSIESGTFVPSRIPEDDGIRELLFNGRGRLRVEPPAPVEAQQLFQQHGEARVDLEVVRGVVVVARGDLEARLAGRAKVELPATALAELDALRRQWVEDGAREDLGAARALIGALAGDPRSQGFVGLWLDSLRHGRVYYRLDPTAEEAMSVGAFDLFEDRDFKSRARKRFERKLDRVREAQRRKAGEVAEEDPWVGPVRCGWDPEAAESPTREEALERDEEPEGWSRVWISYPLTDPGSSEGHLEPEHYEIDVQIDEEAHGLLVMGRSRMRLKAGAAGLRVLPLTLGPQMVLCDVRTPAGGPLPFVRRDWQALVSLEEPTEAGESIELELQFGGYPIDHWAGKRQLQLSTHWYPHAGEVDLATYDVTLRWPRSLTLLTGGRPRDQGEDGGQRWQHRVFEHPVSFVSFELGDYDVVEDRIGHVELTFGFNRKESRSTPEMRQDVMRTVKASLLFFESRLGWLPIDHLTVVAVDRGYSQSLAGFITLSDGMVHHLSLAPFDSHVGPERRLELIAHEMAHQWWGHVVGWASGRDQWLSEALADYSAATFMSKIAGRPEVYYRRRAQDLRRQWDRTTFDGRPLASLGSVLLGTRLYAGHGSGAYVSTIYAKGSAIFDMLASQLGEDATWQMLGRVTRSEEHRLLRTPAFFEALESMSGRDLDPFVTRYVEGSGIPLLVWHSGVRQTEAGVQVTGEMKLLPPVQYRYALRRTSTGWDVVKQLPDEPPLEPWAIVPYVVETSSGSRIEGTFEARGERVPFSIDLRERPQRFSVDPDGHLVADVLALAEDPQRARTRTIERLFDLGRFEEALSALESSRQTDGTVDGAIEARLHLLEARARLDRGDEEGAKKALDAAERALAANDDSWLGERVLLAARLSFRTGRHEVGLARLRKYISDNRLELARISTDALLDDSALHQLEINRGEYLALLAVGARLEADPDAALLARLAALVGVDMTALQPALEAPAAL